MTQERRRSGADEAQNDWIEWGGGDCPVEPDTIVCIRVRGGEETPARWNTPASTWNWRWTDERFSEEYRSGDIIAYRVVSA